MTDADCATYYTGGTSGARTPQAGDFQLCLTAGIPNNSEYSVSPNHDVDRFDRTRGDVSAEPARPDTYQFPGNQLVLAGFLYPSTDDQPNGFSPSGREIPKPDPQGTSGRVGDGEVPTLSNSPGVEFACFQGGQASGFKCPGSDALGHPNHAAPYLTSCDSAVLAETSACSPALGVSTNPAVPGCGNGVVDFTTGADALFEQCDVGAAGGAVFDDDGITPLTCDRVYSQFRIKALGQTREQATPGRKLTGGVVRCRPNCLFDLSQCVLPFRTQGFTDSGGATTPAQPDGVVQLWEAHKQSATTLFAEVFDKRGSVEKRPNVQTGALDALSPAPGASNGRGLNLAEMGPSNHGMFAFIQRLSRYHPEGWPVGTAPGNLSYSEVWGVTFAMDDAEFASAAGEQHFSGVLHEVRSFTLEFAMDYRNNTSTLIKVNGQAFDPGSWPVLNVGDNLGTALSDAWGTQVPTGPLKDRATTSGIVEPFQLRVDLRGLAVARRGDWNCSKAWAGSPPPLAVPTFGTPNCDLLGRGPSVAASPGIVQMYARNDLFTLPGSAQEYEAPQYPSLTYVNRKAPNPAEAAARLHAVSFNDTLKRYDSSEGTIRQALGGGAAAVQSDWDNLQATLCDRFGIDVTQGTIRRPFFVQNINPDPPADCGNVSFNDDFIAERTPNFDSDTQVVFVMDKSGSMNTTDATTLNPAGRKRLDFAKFAARNFFTTIAKPSLGPRIGLSFYSAGTFLKFPQVSGPSCSTATEATDCGSPPFVGVC